MEAWVAGGPHHRHYPKVARINRRLQFIQRQLRSTRTVKRRRALFDRFIYLLVGTFKEAEKWTSYELYRHDMNMLEAKLKDLTKITERRTYGTTGDDQARRLPGRDSC